MKRPGSDEALRPAGAVGRGVPPDWSRPLRLVAALLSVDGVCPVEAEGLSAAEWARFADLVIDRQRVAPQVAPRLADLPVPPDVARRIGDEVQRNARLTLLGMAELRRVLSEFAGIGVTPIVLKGFPLGEALYGSAAGRHSRDLDLLIPAGAVAGCGAALSRLGYRVAAEHTRRGRLLGSRALTGECNDIAFEHADSPLAVELHWRPTHPRFWPDPLGCPGAVVTRRTGIGDLLVPSDEANMIYLALHGAMHRWGRLKWLADMARLAQRRGPEMLSADLARARDERAWRPVALALRLAGRLLGAPLPRELSGPPRALARSEADAMHWVASEEAAAATLRGRLGFYTAGLRLADGTAQRLGIVRYASWRHLRLMAADLAGR